MSDLKKIEKKLRKRLSELQERSDEIEDELGEQGDNDFAEMSVESSNDEVLISTNEAAEEEISQILEALDRIQSGDYGKCQSCDKAIPQERLEAIPYTVHCVQCAEEES